jgi:xylulokinase
MDITGTWEMLIRGCRKLDLSPGSARSGYYIEGHVVPDSWCICESNVSGDMVEWFRHTIAAGEEEQAKKEGKSVWEFLMRDIGKSPPGSKGCSFLPHFSGSNSPDSEPTSLGAFAGLHNKITKPDMLHAILEGLTYKMREMMEVMTGGNPLPEKIIATGGAVRNPIWMQMKADVTGIPIEAPGLYEATPLGAAMLAGLGIGVYKNDREAVAAVYKKGILYEPACSAHEKYTDLYLNVYRLLQPSLARVNANVHRRFIEQG